jgi:YegS/Rv2252/BmrU family lipid kinase
MEKIAVVINAGAGQGNGGELADKVVAAFARHGLAAQVSLARDGAQVAGAVRAALAQGARTVVGGGGDGTLNQVASTLLEHAGETAALGVLPLGTLNHFAKDLGIPLELEEAVAVIARGQVVEVDTAEVNGKLFLNNSSIGLYPDIVHERERQQARLGRGKWPAFVWACLAALRRFPFHTVTLSVEGQKHVRQTAFVFVGNNDYCMQGVDIGERACLDAGQLCVYVARHATRWGLFVFALAALFGQLQRVRGLDHLLTEQLRIETHTPTVRVATDGEVAELDTPLEYRSRPRSLRVLVPAPGAAGIDQAKEGT